MSLKVPERYRVKEGPMASHEGFRNNGAFRVPTFDNKVQLIVIASDQMGWDHVSVSTKSRVPTWDEMQYIKGMFWENEDTVFQVHPPQSKYINKCENCLHMWRNHNAELELPPSIMVG